MTTMDDKAGLRRTSSRGPWLSLFGLFSAFLFPLDILVDYLADWRTAQDRGSWHRQQQAEVHPSENATTWWQLCILHPINYSRAVTPNSGTYPFRYQSSPSRLAPFTLKIFCARRGKAGGKSNTDALSIDAFFFPRVLPTKTPLGKIPCLSV